MREKQIQIKKGDQVIFKKEWMDKGDEGVVFIAISDQQAGTSNVRVEAQLPNMAFKPNQWVQDFMIERVIPAAKKD